jgi:hypothetical protein
MLYIAYLVQHYLQVDPALNLLLLPADSPEARPRNDIHWAELLVEYVRGRNNMVKMMARVTDSVSITGLCKQGEGYPNFWSCILPTSRLT